MFSKFNWPAVILGVTTLLFAGSSVWVYVNFVDARDNVDSKITEAVAVANKEKDAETERKIQEVQEQPYNQFTGPDDYGRLTFDYPKNWDVYQATDVSQGGGVTYEAYLNPIFVPPVTKTQKFAIRVTIEQKTYDKVLENYNETIKEGSLKSTAFTSEYINGTRLDGNFTDEIRGSAIVVKMRDRTLTIRTDADVFKPYFENIIKTVQFKE